MGFENDKLDREKYAKFLTEIISNTNRYKAQNDSNSFVLAIDSSWGTGKTTFINMWKEKLERDNYNFNVIKFNAWENDYSKNSLSAVIYSIVNDEIFNNQRNSQIIKNSANSLKNAVGKLLKSFIKFKIRNIVGEDASDQIGDLFTEVTDATENGINNILNPDYSNEKIVDFCKEYKDYYKAIKEIKESLEGLTKEKKLVIMIDELDRCKPLFAIELLESIKHILDCKNIVFVFALDMEQLSYSVKCVYGQDMDACGYLCRFFDYISKMPMPNLNVYLDYLKTSKPLNISSTLTNSNKFEDDIFQNLCLLFEKMKLSLRDVNIVYNNFLMFEKSELKDTDNINAYVFYIFLIVLKYKYLDEYNNVIKNGNIDFTNHIYIKYSLSNDFRSLENQLLILQKNETIVSMKGNIYDESKSIIDINNIKNIVYCNGKVLLKSGSISREFNSNFSYNGILFYDDLKKFEEIKSKKLCNYIQEKLELFDFEFYNKEKKN